MEFSYTMFSNYISNIVVEKNMRDENGGGRREGLLVVRYLYLDFLQEKMKKKNMKY